MFPYVDHASSVVSYPERRDAAHLEAKGPAGRQHYVLFVSCMTAVLSLTAISEMKGAEAVVLVHLGERLSVAFQVDGLGCVFGTMVSLLWPLACLYALEYMSREGGEDRFFSFYLAAFGVTLASPSRQIS